ncbi:MAG: 2'-deoxycytidine 5'-triphosphate deaminase [bacterium]|jgi:dCTP deaminase|nr:2'-deoxycytidine 5'-triphosphate deaminase [Planctomycetota bacterium]
MPTSPTGSLLVDHQLEALFGSGVAVAPNAPALDPTQVQPASLDLRLGARAQRLQAGFLPGAVSVERRIADLGLESLDLDGDGARFERGAVYLVELEEQLDLAPDLRARFNPRSSTGRCDIFTRVLASGHPRFDEAPPGYCGKLWVEVSPLSFSVRLRRGDCLGQMRLQRGRPELNRQQVFAVQERTPLCFDGSRALDKRELEIDQEGCLELTLGLAGRDPAGWKARSGAPELNFSSRAVHAIGDFWEAVSGPCNSALLEPESFYIFASRERLRIPPTLAAEMLPVDVGLGEVRNNYAGFFDNGFGWHPDEHGQPLERGTPAVLEVRAHDVPFLVEEGQPFCRLQFFASDGEPGAIYGAGRRAASYQDQDLTLARPFR